MREKLKILLQRQDSLEKTLFWVFLVIVLLATMVSTIFTIYEQISFATSITCFITTIICGIIAIVALKTRMYSLCYIILCLVLSCFLLPLLFFLCGGFKSGMSLYCLTAILLCAYCPRKSKWIIFCISIFSIEIAFILSKIYPEYVVEIDENAAFIDVLVSFFITGLVGFVISSFALYSYNQQRKVKETMLTRLEFLSKRDSKTGLFNRSYITHFLENTVWPRREGYFLILWDLDKFREINSLYGELFGDQVICDVSKFLLDETKQGECCGRIDGELFASIIQANSEEEAFARADKIREGISNIRWENFSTAKVTVSGSFIYCGKREFTHFSQLLIKAEDSLYIIKSEKCNQIKNAFKE